MIKVLIRKTKQEVLIKSKIKLRNLCKTTRTEKHNSITDHPPCSPDFAPCD